MDAGAELKRRRTGAGLSQRALAELSGVPQPNISEIERGLVQPRPETVRRLEDALRERPSVVLARHREAILEAAARHKITRVRVAGSCARGMDTVFSDIDLLVDLEPEATYFDLAHFEDDLDAILDRPFDVVPAEAQGRVVQRMLAEAVPL
jgi:predicted nucleotidyltransferase